MWMFRRKPKESPTEKCVVCKTRHHKSEMSQLSKSLNRGTESARKFRKVSGLLACPECASVCRQDTKLI